MPRSPVPPLLAALALAAAAGAAPVLWRPVSMEELVTTSDLVVVGRIVAVAPGAPGPDAVDTATLAIERTLHGAAPDDTVPLAFPGKARGTLRADGSLEPDRDPSYVRFELDQDGVFFLRRRSDGSFAANHPARFKPRFFLAEVTAFLAAR